MNDADFPSAGLQQAIERLAKMPASDLPVRCGA